MSPACFLPAILLCACFHGSAPEGVAVPVSAPTQATQAAAAVAQRHTVTVDGHPIAVHSKRPARPRAAVVLVHGRTWSGLPDFDLQVPGAQVSLMDALVAAGVAAYAVDLRGYGATPRDASGFATPQQSAADVAAVLRFVADDAGLGEPPHLLGWSMGALVSALTVQLHPELARGLVLYGYPCRSGAPAPAVPDPETPRRAANTASAAASDFITRAAVSRGVIDGFVAAALAADPVRADWRGGAAWSELSFARLRVPVLLLHGEHDPFVDRACLFDQFSRLASVDRRWQILAGADHAAHLETAAPRFVAAVVDFMAIH